MQPTATANGHHSLDEPIITTREELRRQVREEVEQAMRAAKGRRWKLGDIVQIAALVWLGLTLIVAGLGIVPIG